MGRLKEHFRSLFVSSALSWDQVRDLLWSRGHSPYLTRHRAAVIVDRVRIVSAVFAVLTPLWIAVDAVVFPWPEWGVLAAARVVSSLVFAALAWPWKVDKNARAAFVMLTAMLVNPPLFYLVSLPLFDGMALAGAAEVVAALYALLPFVMVAGLGVFPLTVFEVLLYALPVIVMTALGSLLGGAELSLSAYVGKLWLLFLILGVGVMAGVGQLRYMIALVSRASQDPLTGVFTRRSGAEIIDLQYRVSERQDTPFAVAFFDLDKFKSINDVHGHEAGDEALRMFVANLKTKLRRGDVIVRWGGEEFLVLLGNIDCEGLKLVLGRMTTEWFGTRPDGAPLTASIGIAERSRDKVGDWPELVELADQRMYKAKTGGRARAVICGDEVVS